MSTDPALDQLTREELIARARALGARRPEVMTRVELRDEIVRLSEPDPVARKRSRGWLGVARDLVASVMDAGLNMPAAAKAIRGDARPAEETTGPPPVATLTLAEIYLAQGHTERALATLDEVLATEPEHEAARELRDRIASGQAGIAHYRAAPSEPRAVDLPLPAPAPFVATPEPPSVEAEPSLAAAEPGAPYSEPRIVVPDAEITQPDSTPPEPYAVTEPNAPYVAVPEPNAPYVVPPVAATEPHVAPELNVALTEPPVAAEAPVAEPPPPVVAEVPVARAEPSEPFGASEPSTAADAVMPSAESDAAQAPESELPVPFSQPVPTLAAPPIASAVTPAGVRPECALVERDEHLEALYSLPPGASGVVLRLAWFVPNYDEPTLGQLDVPLDPVQTRVELPATPPHAQIRAALGTQSGDAFRPLAVAWVYRAAPGELAVAFAPPGAEPTELREQARTLAATG